MSWDTTSSSAKPKGRRIKSDGVPAYLTAIIASPLSWLSTDAEREQIWDAASQRLSERSGRSGMGDLTRKFRIPLTPNGSILELELHEPALTSDNLGFKTWASSYLLAKRLPLLRSQLSGSSVLELGAGTGLVGIAAAAILRTHVVLTDLPEIVPNLDKNLQANDHLLAMYSGSAEAAVLDWSDPASLAHVGKHSFATILAADPLYSPDHPALLAQTVDYHLSRSRDARLVVEFPLREPYASERLDLKTRLERMGLRLLDQGEDVGRDDWGDEGRTMEVRCWWGIWGWE